MNQRIQQLAEQAGIYKLNLSDETEYWIMEKFAELIVKECIQELGISKKCDPYTGQLFVCEHNAVLDEQIDMLKEHFGVEE